MKYIVTGGAGFIGSNLVDELIAMGNEVHVIDNFSKDETSKIIKFFVPIIKNNTEISDKRVAN